MGETNTLYVELLEKFSKSSSSPTAATLTTHLQQWLTDALISWFKTGHRRSLAPFDHYFLGREEFEYQFMKMFENEFSSERVLGETSPRNLFIKAVALVVSNRSFYEISSDGFKCLLQFLEKTDYTPAIYQLTRLACSPRFIGYTDDWGRSLFPNLVRSVYSSGYNGTGAKRFFNATYSQLVGFSNLTILVLERQLSFTESFEETQACVLEIRDAYNDYKGNVAKNRPNLIGKIDREFYNVTKKFISAEFISYINTANTVEASKIQNHPLMATFFTETNISPLPKKINETACQTDLRALYVYHLDKLALAKDVMAMV